MAEQPQKAGDETEAPESTEAEVVEVILPDSDKDSAAEGEDGDDLGLDPELKARRAASLAQLENDGAKTVSAPAENRDARSLDRSDPLTRYMNMIRRYPVLEADEQEKLAWRYVDDKDQDAAQALLMSNLRLVVKIALQYWRRWADVMDLVAQGNLGLVEAIERFDPSRGIRFPSYAQYWIRAFILSYMMDHFRVMKLSSSRAGRKLFWRLNKERRALAAEGYEPTTKLLAERTGVSEEDVEAVARVLDAPAKSLSAPVAGEEGRTLGEMLPDKVGVSPESAAAEMQLSERLSSGMATFRESLTLDPKDAKLLMIWDERLAAAEPKTLNQLGDQIGVSRERVRQLEVRLKKRARDFLARELGDDVVLELTES